MRFLPPSGRNTGVNFIAPKFSDVTSRSRNNFYKRILRILTINSPYYTFNRNRRGLLRDGGFIGLFTRLRILYHSFFKITRKPALERVGIFNTLKNVLKPF